MFIKLMLVSQLMMDLTAFRPFVSQNGWTTVNHLYTFKQLLQITHCVLLGEKV